MKIFRKLFFEIEMTWKKLIIFAVGSAIFTALLNCIPVLENTSFVAPAQTFEIWVLFAVIVIFNCKGYKEAMAKTFVFFLVSQPLIYLFEVPFKAEGFGLFKYYPGWFVWTICTIPGAAIAYYVKKQTALSGVIIALANILVLAGGLNRVNILISEFPRYLLLHLFCLICVIAYITVLLEGKRNKLVAGLITVIALGALLLMELNFERSSSLKYPIDTAGDWQVEECSEDIEAYVEGDYMHIKAQKTGEYTFTIKNEKGESITYDVDVDSNTGLIDLHKR